MIIISNDKYRVIYETCYQQVKEFEKKMMIVINQEVNRMVFIKIYLQVQKLKKLVEGQKLDQRDAQYYEYLVKYLAILENEMKISTLDEKSKKGYIEMLFKIISIEEKYGYRFLKMSLNYRYQRLFRYVVRVEQGNINQLTEEEREEYEMIKKELILIQFYYKVNYSKIIRRRI